MNYKYCGIDDLMKLNNKTVNKEEFTQILRNKHVDGHHFYGNGDYDIELDNIEMIDITVVDQ